MGISLGVAAAVEGVRASVAALDGLEREDASLDSAGVGAAPGTGSEVDVLQRRYELCLERLEVVARLEAQLAALKARDVAECLGFQHAMLPPDASLQDRTYEEMSVVEEIAGVLTVSSAAAGPRPPSTTLASPDGPGMDGEEEPQRRSLGNGGL